MKITRINPVTVQYTDASGFKAVQVLTHDDGTRVVRFGYADTTVRDPKNPLTMPTLLKGTFSEEHAVRSKTYQTLHGAARAVERWLK
jgi:hypothetical protein